MKTAGRCPHGLGTLRPELADGGVQYTVVYRTTPLGTSSKDAELVFHVLVVALINLSLLAVEDLGRQGVAPFLQLRMALMSRRQGSPVARHGSFLDSGGPRSATSPR